MAKTPFDYRSSTALVTGATSGIGLANVRALVGRGTPRVLIVAQDEERLRAVAADLSCAPHAPQVECFSANLSAEDGPARVRAEADRLGWPIDLLVNNAGLGSSGTFGSGEERNDPLAVVSLNVRAVVALSALFLPDMVGRGRGAVINIGSTAGLGAVPFSAVYAASKAFVISFSRALWTENRSKGVRFVCVLPGVTRTNLGGPGRGESRGGLEKVLFSQPEEVADTALRLLDDNRPARIVGRANRALQVGLKLLPGRLVAGTIARFKNPEPKPGQ